MTVSLVVTMQLFLCSPQSIFWHTGSQYLAFPHLLHLKRGLAAAHLQQSPTVRLLIGPACACLQMKQTSFFSSHLRQSAAIGYQKTGSFLPSNSYLCCKWRHRTPMHSLDVNTLHHMQGVRDLGSPFVKFALDVLSSSGGLLSSFSILPPPPTSSCSLRPPFSILTSPFSLLSLIPLSENK